MQSTSLTCRTLVISFPHLGLQYVCQQSIISAFHPIFSMPFFGILDISTSCKEQLAFEFSIKNKPFLSTTHVYDCDSNIKIHLKRLKMHQNTFNGQYAIQACKKSTPPACAYKLFGDFPEEMRGFVLLIKSNAAISKSQ